MLPEGYEMFLELFGKACAHVFISHCFIIMFVFDVYLLLFVMLYVICLLLLFLCVLFVCCYLFFIVYVLCVLCFCFAYFLRGGKPVLNSASASQNFPGSLPISP